MANTVTTNPMEFGTAATVSSGSIAIHTITWSMATDSGLSCIVTDIYGTTIFHAQTGINYRDMQVLNFPYRYNSKGLVIKAIDAGIVRIFS